VGRNETPEVDAWTQMNLSVKNLVEPHQCQWARASSGHQPGYFISICGWGWTADRP